MDTLVTLKAAPMSASSQFEIKLPQSFNAGLVQLGKPKVPIFGSDRSARLLTGNGTAAIKTSMEKSQPANMVSKERNAKEYTTELLRSMHR